MTRGVVSSFSVSEKWVVYLRKSHVAFDLFVWAYHYFRISAQKSFFFDQVWSEQISQQKTVGLHNALPLNSVNHYNDLINIVLITTSTLSHSLVHSHHHGNV